MSESLVNEALMRAGDALDEAIRELEGMSERALTESRYVDDRNLVEQIAVLTVAGKLITEHVV